MADTKLTKAKLLSLLDDRLQRLNLLKAALQAESHIKQVTLDDYKRRFDEVLTPAKAKRK